MKRSRSASTVIRNYKYAVYLTENLPEQLWIQGRLMNELWNAMIDCRENFVAELQMLRGEEEQKDADKIKNGWTPDKESSKLLWRDFERKLEFISNQKEWKEKLGWEARELILESFLIASTSAFKNKSKLRRKTAFLETVVIPHRFGEGGWKLDSMYRGKSKKLFIKPLPDEVFEKRDWQSRRARLTTGIYGYGLGDIPVRFGILLHRQPPSGARIKQTRLHGKFNRLSKTWTWHLILTCQSDAVEQAVPFKPVAALDLNYRKMGDYLRVGYLVDSGGNEFEFRLPIADKPSRRLLNALKSVNNARRHQNLNPLAMEEFYPANLIDISNWRSRNDLFLEEIKGKLLELLGEQTGDLPEEIRAAAKNLIQVRRTGLLKIWEYTRQATDERLVKIHRLLDDWRIRDLEVLKKISVCSTQLINKRNKLYENIALWLKGSFSYLIWEKDFSLQKLAESASKISMNSTDVGAKIGARYRYYAGLYFLREKLKQLNTNAWLISGTMSYSTVKCHICQSIAESANKLHIVCPNGHKADQDFQACKNLLKELPEDLVFDRRETKPDIPAHLAKYIIKCSG